MEQKNILLNNANYYNSREAESLSVESGHCYDNELGYWVRIDNNAPSVLDSTFAKPRSKKCDMETGEDKKGE